MFSAPREEQSDGLKQLDESWMRFANFDEMGNENEVLVVYLFVSCENLVEDREDVVFELDALGKLK